MGTEQSSQNRQFTQKPRPNPAQEETVGQTVQQARLRIPQLQRLVGNVAVQRLLAQNRVQMQSRSGAVPVARLHRTHSTSHARESSPTEKPSIDRAVVETAFDNPNPLSVEHLKEHGIPRVQRDGTTDTQAVPTITIDGIQMSYCRDLVSWYTLQVLKLKNQQDEMRKDEAPEPVLVKTAIDEGESQKSDCQAKSDEPIDTGAALSAQAWFDYKFTKAMNEAEAAKAEEAAKRIQKAEEHFNKLKQDMEQRLLPDLRDLQRASFRSSDDNKLLQVSDTIATVLDCSLTLGDTAKAIAEDVATLQNMANVAKGYTGVYPTINSKVTMVVELATKIDKAYAAFQLVRAGIDLLSPKKTASGEAAAGVSAMSTVVTAGGTLLGASAGLTLYFNLYIGPMVGACLTMISKIEDMRSRTVNRAFIEMGEFDSVNWLIEPGGRPVFDFMLQVMRAGGPEDIPKPVPKTVSSYFVDNQSDLEAGSGGKEMPTKGWWFWKSIDQEKIARWVFRNRENLWGMLYGSARAPL